MSGIDTNDAQLLRNVDRAELREPSSKEEVSMLRKLGFTLMSVTMFGFCATTSAQMVVHAVAGMVKVVNTDSKTMIVTEDNGEASIFNLPTNAKVSLDFDKALQSDSVNASQFQHLGDYAVVYYYGYANDRTVVAVKDLGAGPFQKSEGTVVGFDKHARVMTLKDSSGKSNVFALSEHLVVDSDSSVASGRGYDPHKGDYVVVTYAQAGDKNSAVFVHSRK